jgi:hypothetical protein
MFMITLQVRVYEPLGCKSQATVHYADTDLCDDRITTALDLLSTGEVCCNSAALQSCL